MPNFSLCVFCGSKSGNDPAWMALARNVGTWIGSRAGQLVYGGGRQGLMGALADATMAAGGRVVGVMPDALVAREWAHDGCHELLRVGTMHERKRIMAERADAFLALPGGIGTFEEFFEAWTWRQLGYHSKPVGLLNADGYYDALLSFLQQTVHAGFMEPSQVQLLKVGEDSESLLTELVQGAGPAAPSRTDLI